MLLMRWRLILLLWRLHAVRNHDAMQCNAMQCSSGETTVIVREIRRTGMWDGAIQSRHEAILRSRGCFADHDAADSIFSIAASVDARLNG